MAFSTFSSVNSLIKYSLKTTPTGDITTNLLIYYKCKSGDISGSNLTDYSGNGYTASLNGSGITISSNTCPKASYALTLSSSSNQYLTIPTFSCSSGYISLACWINIKSTTNTYARVFNFYPGYGGNNYAQCLVVGNTTSNTLYISDFDSSAQGSYFPLGSNGNLSLGWHHICVVVKNGSPLAFYIDNVNYPSSFNCGTIESSFTNGMIGRDSSNNLSNFDFCEYRIYNRALSSTDVNTLYNYTQS